MAKRMVTYELTGGGSVTFEVEDTTQGLVPVARGSDEVIKAAETFESALEHIKPAVDALRAKLDGLKAHEVEVTFGLKLSATAGVIVASGAVEANYAVKLKWDNREES